MRKGMLFLLLALLSCSGRQPCVSMLDRWAQKPVLASCLLDDMEGEGRWVVLEGNPSLEYTRENVHSGRRALRQRVSLVDSTSLLDPANRTPWNSRRWSPTITKAGTSLPGRLCSRT